MISRLHARTRRGTRASLRATLRSRAALRSQVHGTTVSSPAVERLYTYGTLLRLR